MARLDETGNMTVQDLLSVDTLRSHLVAGHDGLHRTVTWAHSSELMHPERWLNAGEILMSVGYAVPQDADEQVQFIRELDAAGSAGLMLCHHESQPTMPTISAQMLKEADRLGYPVAFTHPDVPWSAVTRHIVAHTEVAQAHQMILLTKMYEIAIASRSGDIVQQLSTLLDTDIIIEDGATGLVVMGADSIADDRTRERRYPLGLPEHGTMRIGESAANPLNSLLLVHLQRILETELSRFQLAVRDYTLTSQKNFRTLLSKRELSADESLTGQLNPAGGFRVIAVEADGLPLLATQSWLKGLRLLLGEHGPYTVMYVGLEDVPVVKNLILQSSIVGGISVPFRSLAFLDIGIEESVSALREAVRRQSDWVEYERMNLGVLARSEWEAREIVADALGPLAERGEKSDVLRDTLFVFLECERNWADTATRLGIHRQTLAYRLKRVETATGRDLRTTSALSILWLAYQAWKQYFD